MKRMVKNGNLIDVEPDGTITVAGKPIGGGGDDKVLSLIAPYSYQGSTSISDTNIYLDDDVWNKISDLYYETIKIYYNDGRPLGIFNVLNLKSYSYVDSQRYACVSKHNGTAGAANKWYGQDVGKFFFASLYAGSNSTGKYINIQGERPITWPSLEQSKFDDLYKLADKPTQDGTYVLKATVSGGAVTYTWVAQ